MAQKTKPMDLASLKVKYDLLVETLKSVDFNKVKAAQKLNIDRKTIHNIIKMYRKHFLTEETQSA
jgi:DNA-binding NtrC family response regulator